MREQPSAEATEPLGGTEQTLRRRERLRDVALEACELVGPRLRAAHGNIEDQPKSERIGDTVTELDRWAERRISENLLAAEPDAGLFGEEYGGDMDHPRLWLVDPVDGTWSFVRGLPFCTTMIAFAEDHRPTVAVIYDFLAEAAYTAVRGGGAYRDGQRLHVGDRALAQAMISFETDLSVGDNAALFTTVAQRAGLIKTFNSGWEFAHVASGQLDARVCKDPFGQPYDFAAGMLLVKEAGGVARNLGSDDYDLRDTDLIAANTRIDAQLRPLIG